VEFNVSGAEIENMEAQIAGGIADKQSLLIDVVENVPKEEEAFEALSEELPELAGDQPNLDEGLDFDLGEMPDLEADLPIAESDTMDTILADSDSGESLDDLPQFDAELGDGAESLDEDSIGELDEVGTKLDLARAYVDMGDPAGARSILEEVLDEGDEAQRQQAQQLLDSLPS